MIFEGVAAMDEIPFDEGVIDDSRTRSIFRDLLAMGGTQAA